MKPNEIRRLLDQRPFPCFRLHVSDGQSYDVRFPEMVLVTEGLIHIGQEPMDGKVPCGLTVYCDPEHITRMEPLNGGKRRPYLSH